MKQYKTDNQLIYEAYISRADFEKSVDFNNHTDDEKEFLNTIYELSSEYYAAVREVRDYIRRYITSNEAFGVLIWEGQRIDLKGTFSGLKNIAKELLKILGVTEEDEEDIDNANIMQQLRDYSGVYDANGTLHDLPGVYVFAIDDIILAVFDDINAFDKWVKIEEEAMRASYDESMLLQFRNIVKTIHAKFDAR